MTISRRVIAIGWVMFFSDWACAKTTLLRQDFCSSVLRLACSPLASFFFDVPPQADFFEKKIFFFVFLKFYHGFLERKMR
jgi:hypothetical protein